MKSEQIFLEQLKNSICSCNDAQSALLMVNKLIDTRISELQRCAITPIDRQKRKAACNNILRVSMQYEETVKRNYTVPHWVCGKQVFSDGFRVLELTKPLSMETTSNNVNFLNIEKVFAGITFDKYKEMDYPPVEILRGWMPKYTVKTEDIYYMLMWNNKICVNLMYFMSMLEALGDARVYWNGKSESYVFFVNSLGERGLLCPIKQEYRPEYGSMTYVSSCNIHVFKPIECFHFG